MGKRELIFLVLSGLGTGLPVDLIPVFPVSQNSSLEPVFSDSLCFPALSKDT